MELLVFDEPKAAPFPGFRWRLTIWLNPAIDDFVGFQSRLVFDDWTDALVAGALFYREWLRITHRPV